MTRTLRAAALLLGLVLPAAACSGGETLTGPAEAVSARANLKVTVQWAEGTIPPVVEGEPLDLARLVVRVIDARGRVLEQRLAVGPGGIAEANFPDLIPSDGPFRIEVVTPPAARVVSDPAFPLTLDLPPTGATVAFVLTVVKAT